MFLGLFASNFAIKLRSIIFSTPQEIPLQMTKSLTLPERILPKKNLPKPRLKWYKKYSLARFSGGRCHYRLMECISFSILRERNPYYTRVGIKSLQLHILTECDLHNTHAVYRVSYVARGRYFLSQAILFE